MTMTRNKAIQVLDNERNEYIIKGCQLDKAIDMAIEALKEQEISSELQEYAYECGYEHFFHECQNCEHRRIGDKADGDLISRADAVKAWEELSVRGRTEFDQVLMTLPSVEAVQGWIPFTRRPMTEEEQKDYPNCTFIFDCVLPYDGDEILVSNGRFVWTDTFCNDIDGCYLEGDGDIDEDMAWMPLPKPYKSDGE